MPYAKRSCETCHCKFTPRRRDQPLCGVCYAVGKTAKVKNRSAGDGGPPPPPPVPTKQDREIVELQGALDRALRGLAQAKGKSDRLVQAIYQAAHDGISSLSFPPVPPPKAEPRTKDGEVAIAVISDVQLAKVTPDYDSRVSEKRLEEYGDKVIKLAEIQRADHPVRELRVWLLGDIVEGELIFPGQAHLVDASLYRQVTVDGPRILGNFLRKMLGSFEKIHVVGVIGNHGALGGRSRREYNPESNADRMLYRVLRLMFEGETRITWNIPEGPNERHWYAIDKVGDYAWLLCHGDQFRWGVKTPSCEQKVLGWRTGGVREPFNEVVCGHWHNMNLLTLRGGTTTLRVNGSTESFNTYAQEHIGSMSSPAQWLLFAHPKRGTTAEYRVSLK